MNNIIYNLNVNHNIIFPEDTLNFSLMINKLDIYLGIWIMITKMERLIKKHIMILGKNLSTK